MKELYNFTGWSASWQSGVWWFRVCGWGLMLKAPWSMKLFSERNGKREYWPKDGWRVRFLKRKYEE
jgi:hypothetical protein